MMTKQQAKKTKWAMEDFFYKSRYNIALNQMLDSTEFGNFKSVVESALKKQIMVFAKVEKINEAVGVSKALRELPLEDSDIVDNLRRNWIPLLAILDEETIFDYLFWANQKGGQATLSKLKLDAEFNLTDQTVLDRIRSRVISLAEIVDNTTLDWIARTIAQGLKNGISHVEIVKAIRDEARKIAEERADLIAEQEAALALGEIAIDIFRRNGIDYHDWITQRDEMVCNICISNEEAGTVKVGELFPSGVLAPPAHPRCRCIDMPVIPDNIEITWTGQ